MQVIPNDRKFVQMDAACVATEQDAGRKKKING